VARHPELYLIREPLAADEANMDRVHEWERERGGVLWIDARVREVYDRGHIPGALLLNEMEYDTLMFEHLEKLSAATQPILIYCDAQKCDQSRVIAKKLRDLGLTDLWILRGGWQAWQADHATARAQ
jgi:rhodanese-related sulfurtransferase